MTNDDLVQIHLIEQLKFRYLRHLDLKQWDDLADCFTPEATATYGAIPKIDGRDAIIEFLSSSLSSTNMLTSHKAHHPEINLLSNNQANGLWSLEDEVLVLDAAIEIRGCAIYQDEYVLSDTGWLIAHTGYRRIYEDTRPRPIEARITAKWWDAAMP